MAQEFKLQVQSAQDEDNLLTISSQAYTIGDAIAKSRTTGGVIPATSSTVTSAIYAVAAANALSTDTTVLATLVRQDQRWTADTTNTANTAHNFQRMVLTDKGTVNNTGTDNAAGIFEQLGVVGTNRIVGRFLPNASAA